MKVLHIVAGTIGVLIFLGTGLYMKLNFPQLYDGNEALRYMYRANHVYILLAALINLVLGLYLRASANTWRASFSVLGSVFVLFALLLLILAFFIEAPKATPERITTVMGVLLLLLGILAHIPNRLRTKREN